LNRTAGRPRSTGLPAAPGATTGPAFLSGAPDQRDAIERRHHECLVDRVLRDTGREDPGVVTELVRDPGHDGLHQLLVELRPAPELKAAEKRKALRNLVVHGGNLTHVVPPVGQL